MEKKVSRVILNGETIMDIHEDTVSAENLLQDETAHDSAGEPVEGELSIDDFYSISDPASTTISDDDYIPFHDVSDTDVPKKKSLFSNKIDKLKATFVTQNLVHYLSDTNTAIPLGADLDDYTESGTYQCKNSNIATTLLHCPSDCSFKLVVDRAYTDTRSEIQQTILLQNRSSAANWFRSKIWNSDTWGDWKQYASKTDLSEYVPNNASSSITTSIGTLTLCNTGIDAKLADNGVNSTKYPSLANITDKNSLIIARDEAVVKSDGTITHYWYVKNYDTSGNALAQKGIKAIMDKTGTVTWEISDYRNFRKAIRNIDQYGDEISANSDINSYKSSGTFNIASDATAATISNIPVSSAGKLIVLDIASDNYKMQFYIADSNNTVPKLFYRLWNNDNNANTWGQWFTIPAVYKQGTFVDDTSGFVTFYAKVDQSNHGWQFKYDVGNGKLNFNSVDGSGTWMGDHVVYTEHTPPILYCTCDTAAATAAKVATPVKSTSRLRGLRYGQIVAITFTNSNSASSCTLDVDNSGAKSIYYNTSVYTGSSQDICGRANGTVYYMWDGTYWRWICVNRVGDSVKPGTYYGTCSTAANQQVKEVTISDTSFSLVVGTIVNVKFSNTNSYSATSSNRVKLNVNNTGDLDIYYNTGYPTGTSTNAFGNANRMNSYVYNGTDWVWLNCGTEADTATSVRVTTGASTAAKTGWCNDYQLLDKSHVHVLISQSNTAQSKLTLNINSKGAKDIYINGTVSSSTNYTLPAGTYLVYYANSRYYFRTDGKITCAGTVTV